MPEKTSPTPARKPLKSRKSLLFSYGTVRQPGRGDDIMVRSTFIRPVAVIAVAPLIAMALVMAAAEPAAAQKKSGSKKPSPPKIRLPESVRRKAPVAMEVAPVDPSRRDAVALAAGRLDQIVERKLTEQGIVPNEIASDEVFLRRVYLDVAGRIPTLPEAQEFLNSNDPQRREVLIDRLLGSPDYVSNFYNFWADVLRLVERPQPNIVADPYLAYVKDSIRTNVPYDRWVYEMLTADGKLWENPAVGFQLRDEGMPLAYVDNTVRVFLGTQVGCAQCHDHPFDVWTQKDFYRLAAFTAGTRTRIRKGDRGFEKTNPANALINEARKRHDKGRVPGQFQRVARANTYVVSEIDAKLRLPHDYAYSDAKPNEVVEPAVLWGEIPNSERHETGREKFAAWLTSPDNPRFAQTIVNRLWQRFLGVGLVEPIDDFNDDNLPVNEPLMEYLCERFVDERFDLKEFVRTLLYSRTYQREPSDYDITEGEPYHFPGPVVRRMTAEQVWDSLLTLAVHNPMPFQRPTAADLAPVIDLDFGTADYDTVKRLSEAFGETLVVLTTEFGRKPKLNDNAGRDHHPGVFSSVLAGGGVRGGQVYGASDDRGVSVASDRVTVADFNTTIAAAAGLPTAEEFFAPNGRPFKIGGGGKVIRELLRSA